MLSFSLLISLVNQGGAELAGVSSSYQCNGCITNDYPTIQDVYDQFTSSIYNKGDTYSNGVMWFNYSLLTHPSNNFNFKRQAKLSEQKSTTYLKQKNFSPVPCNIQLAVSYPIGVNYQFKIIDAQGTENSMQQIVSKLIQAN